ncbi:hypothetical protein [Streptomyces pristinaespiralis]|uniref:hypothetical protein n=1 Tax=Streptomyces pristinaespiralis TaxID=38300 RepID=UPI003834D0A8
MIENGTDWSGCASPTRPGTPEVLHLLAEGCRTKRIRHTVGEAPPTRGKEDRHR